MLTILPYNINSTYSRNDIYSKSVLNKRNIGFGSINVNKEDAANLRNVPNQCCSCCGKPMISEEEFSSIKRKEYDDKAAVVLKKLQKYSKYMRKTEKTVFNLLKRTAAKFPDSDLNELLKKRYYYHLGRLEAKQLNIIKKATSQKLKLSEASKNELEKSLENVHKIMFLEPKETPQKRNRIIKEFQELKKKCRERNEIDKIIAVILTLPTSINDVDAFMIKYVQRSNAEIGQRLLQSSRRSLDHIHARKSNGKDEFSNLIVTCEKCNQERGHEAYDSWVRSHPKMPKHIKRNLRKVSREIKEGRLQNFDTYPADVARTISSELSGDTKISLNILS